MVLGVTPITPAVAEEPAPASSASEQVFSTEELDQMLAPLALYPDALLAQVLMATTYPGDVADAVTWSTEHPDASGDDAVRQVSDQSWDPSVQSLVAFPAVLATMGQDPAWVQRVGDAFLAQPDAVMSSVQRLRQQAKAAGNLESNDKQKVSEKPAEPAQVTSSGSTQQTIIIESADPQVVYVPSYNPTVVYGTWPYPSYPPVYYPPPGYYFGSAVVAGIGFAAGVAIVDSLWGDCNWGHGDIDIDVNRYNNINDNRQLNVNQNTWKHNAANRDGVPYRDRASREQFSQRLANGEQRQSLRGRDPAQAADRERARQSLQQHGFESPATNNRQALERAQSANREMRNSDQLRQRAQSREPRNTAQSRQQARQQHATTRGARDNAFAGARAPDRERAYQQRGQASRASVSRPQAARASGRAVSRPAMSSRGGARRR
ncbi:DUF3300 domain-containing protein [Pseudomonas sp. Gutcm_11s]|nr:DUF3300 domain-containing protein [Pseudomonas sp. Gutcm_11s]MDD0843948.1 DUF3300 domain-containing protein [Pseudomonas sp. Gutcm_11s]